MDTVTLECVNCGASEQVANAPEALRTAKCRYCGGALVQKRRPGDVAAMPRH